MTDRLREAHPYEIVIHENWRVTSIELWDSGIIEAIRVVITDPAGFEHTLGYGRKNQGRLGGGGGKHCRSMNINDDGQFRISGKANKVIAADLGVSQRTVEIHRAHVMDKMQAASIAQLVRLVIGTQF